MGDDVGAEKRQMSLPLKQVMLCRPECPFAVCIWLSDNDSLKTLDELHLLLCPLRMEWLHHKNSSLSTHRWHALVDKKFLGSPTYALVKVCVALIILKCYV